jgi:hypothetical protein
MGVIRVAPPPRHQATIPLGPLEKVQCGVLNVSRDFLGPDISPGGRCLGVLGICRIALA